MAMHVRDTYGDSRSGGKMSVGQIQLLACHNAREPIRANLKMRQDEAEKPEGFLEKGQKRVWIRPSSFRSTTTARAPYL